MHYIDPLGLRAVTRLVTIHIQLQKNKYMAQSLGIDETMINTVLTADQLEYALIEENVSEHTIHEIEHDIALAPYRLDVAKGGKNYLIVYNQLLADGIDPLRAWYMHRFVSDNAWPALNERIKAYYKNIQDLVIAANEVLIPIAKELVRFMEEHSDILDSELNRHERRRAKHRHKKSDLEIDQAWKKRL